MMRRVSAVAMSVLLLGIPAGAEAQLVGAISDEQEIEVGREAAAVIEEDLTLLKDKVVVDYVNRLGQSLVVRSARPDITYTFKIVDTPDINAFALPGGFIYVNRGLIEAADNESELAGVMAHEIGHVVGRHGVDQMQRVQVVGVGLGVLEAILGDGRVAGVGNVAAELVASGTFLKFSRDAEREADRLGVVNVMAAGHAPGGMVTFFEKLDALREGDPGAVERFFASHPSPRERIENLSGVLDKVRKRFQTNSPEFRRVRARLRSGKRK